MPAKEYLFDLDGTLAYDHPEDSYDVHYVGDPIPGNINNLVKYLLASGEKVVIFTARASTRDYETIFDGTAKEYVALVTQVIQDWTLKHFGVKLPVTCEKTYLTRLIIDDRARQAARNKGYYIEEV
jgi:hydroxymethylpyrimidine pyrophosphatase-like HAD family hydrolase